MSVLSDRTTKKQKAAAEPDAPKVDAAKADANPEETANDLPAALETSEENSGVASVDDLRISPEQFAAEKAAREKASSKVKEPAAPPVPAKPAAVATPKVDAAIRVRVVKDAEFLMGTVMCQFKAGQVLNANHYMPNAFREILSQVHTETVAE